MFTHLGVARPLGLQGRLSALKDPVVVVMVVGVMGSQDPHKCRRFGTWMHTRLVLHPAVQQPDAKLGPPLLQVDQWCVSCRRARQACFEKVPAT